MGELLSLEKQPRLDFTEPAPPSPSTYLDLPPTPRVDSAKDDLSYILRMLMEDDIVDNLYHQYPNHVLLSAEQPFAQILSANTTSDALTTWPCSYVQPSPLQPSEVTPKYYSYCDMIYSEMLPGNNVDSTHVRQDASSLLMHGSMYKVVVEPNRFLPAKSSSMDVISMAFFKGMEEANKFLPSKNDSKTLDHDRVQKKRLQGNDDVDVGMGRSSKQHGPEK